MRSPAAPRTLRVSLVLAVVLASLAGLVSVPTAQAAPFNIPDGDVSALIAAITTANSNGEADTINLATNSIYTLTAVNNSGTSGANGLPMITSEITINGNGATIMRSEADGTPDFRIVQVGDNGNLTLDRVTIANGRAILGAGIFNHGSTGSSRVLTLTNSTVTDNIAVNDGGGINSQSGSTLLVINSTISGNVANNAAGGMTAYGPATVINSTISRNTTGSIGGGGIVVGSPTPISLTNTIVAGNTAGNGTNDVYSLRSSVTGTYNLIGDDTGMTGLVNGVDGNLVGTAVSPIDPLLGPLQDNGGPTPTMALQPGSPAFDAGTTTSETPTTDQRGIARPQGTANDIGAYEWNDSTPPTITSTIIGTQGTNGWYTSDVTVSWNVSEPESLILSSNGCEPTTITTDTVSQTLPCDATSVGGTTSAPVTIKRDTVNPTVTYTGNLGTYALTDTIAITCTATDATSGIATDTCTDISGDATTFGLGMHTFSATATDNAGNVGTGTTSFVIGVSYAQLCTLTKDVASHPILANTACASLILAQRADQANNAQVERVALTLYRFQIRLAMALRAISTSDGQNLLDWLEAVD